MDGNRLLFTPYQLSQDSSLGMPVRADYYWERDRFQFYSRISGSVGLAWVLDLPCSISRSDRRSAERKVIQGKAGYVFEVYNRKGTGMGMLALYDISPQGLGILLPPDANPIASGELLTGVLHLPQSSTAISLSLESRNLREGRRGEQILGCKIYRIQEQDRQVIASVILEGGR